jgi:hypothetical protein
MSEIHDQLARSMAEARGIVAPAALPPPIIGVDVPDSAPGVPQPVISTGPSLPPSFPLGSAGTWVPPPQFGMGGNAPAPTPVVPAGTGLSYTVPTYASGSATVPTSASLFPSYSAAGPFQPIVLTTIMNTSLETSQTPTTAGTQPIIISTTPIPGIPWTGMFSVEASLAEETATTPTPKLANKKKH